MNKANNSGKRANKGGATATATPPAPQKVIDTKKLPADPKNKEQEIKGLLAELETETDANEKKRIRRSLRAKGHYGGTRTKDQLIVSKEDAHKKGQKQVQPAAK